MSADTVTIDIVMPRLGETMEEGVVRDWLRGVGDRLGRGDAILEIETDKTIAEVPALTAGTLVAILAESGDTLAVGAPLGRIEVAAADAPVGRDAATQEEAPGASTDADAVTSAGPDADAAVPTDRDTASETPDRGSEGDPVRATPAARRVARHHGIRVQTVTGTGRRGRVEVADVVKVAGGSALAPDGAAAGPAPAIAHAGDIAYIVAGPADGTPTLLLHGFAADHTAWAVTTRALARAGRRVVAPDLPGHGATRLEASDAAGLGAGLAAFVGDTFGGTAPHVVAHSLGAAPALALADALAGTSSVASLTLIAPAGMGLGIDATFVRAMASPGSTGELAHLLRRLAVRPAALSPAALEALYRTLSRGRLRALAESLLGAAGQTLDLVGAVERVSRELPVRAIVGHRDRIVDWQDVFALPSRVAVHHLVDAGHMPHWDAPREVLELLLEGARA